MPCERKRGRPACVESYIVVQCVSTLQLFPYMAKSSGFINSIIRLRFLVGFLGEKPQAGWWDSRFLDSTGDRFLSATFPRTFLVAGIRSTAEAARIVHDSQIGRVGIFHLFRLPVDVEDRLEVHLSEVDDSWSKPTLCDRHDALIELRQFSEARISAPKGPVQIGVPSKILTTASVSELAAHYESAFSSGFQCFPYFAPNANGKR
jgi:hypothetical protein